MNTIVMNNDVLCLILNELNAKELLRLERVSQQFKQCVNYALKRINGLMIGHNQYNQQSYGLYNCGGVGQHINYGYINDFFKERYDYFLHLNESREAFESIAEKFSHIKALYLSHCLIDYKTVQLIANRCPQLRSLAVDYIFCPSDAEDWEQISTELSKLDLIHLTINGIELMRSNSSKLMTKLNYLVQCLSSLQTLIVCNYNNSKLIELFECLPQSIRYLHLIGCQSLNIDSINTLIGGKGKYLNELKINPRTAYSHNTYWGPIGPSVNQNTEIFAKNSENLSLKKLNFISIKKFKTQINVQNLKALEYLTINTMIEINSVFNRLKYLCLTNCGLKPKSLNNLGKRFPILRKLLLNFIYFYCECNESKELNSVAVPMHPIEAENPNDCNDCEDCIAKCMNSLSGLPKLKHFCIVCQNMEEVLDNCLNLIELNYLDLKCVTHFDKHVVKRFVRFCRHAFDNRVSDHSFAIVLNESIYSKLIDSLNHIVIPKQFKFKPIAYYHQSYEYEYDYEDQYYYENEEFSD